ncbi:hypothetical protein [Ferruginibacter sp.]|uniref:hypothetical protein n=1 Tax=Ferruginibacter sp. TaxID=1940288 RepID=UPI0026582F33|nr:hypothetical protein [Ferruginibacter sp.]
MKKIIRGVTCGINYTVIEKVETKMTNDRPIRKFNYKMPDKVHFLKQWVVLID